MDSLGDDEGLSTLDLVGEARDATKRLVTLLRELRVKKSSLYDEIFNDICSKLDLVNSEISVEVASPQNDIQVAPLEAIEFKIVHVDKAGLNSFFQPVDFSQQILRNRNLRAQAVDDVILGLLFANGGGKRTIAFQNVADELIRLGLGEQPNTTYARISRLRKDKLVAESNPDDRLAYFLTAAGIAYTQKRMIKRGIARLESGSNPLTENCDL